MRRAAIFLMLFSLSAAAWEVDEELDDPALEARARAISAQIRCVVCKNESIDDSEVSRARDLRLLVRERLVAGDDDAEVVAFLRERFGDSVLMSPPFNVTTAVLWIAPVLLLIFGGAAFYSRRRGGEEEPVAPPAPAPLSEEEKRRLRELDVE